MEDFTFHNPTKIIFGKKTIKRIGRELSLDGVSRVVMVYGGGSVKTNGVYEAAVQSLEKHGIAWAEVSGVVTNPLLSKVYETVEALHGCEAQAVLAVGGGSVIDTAKAAAAGAMMDDVWDAFAGKARIDKALPVYAILTLSGTGSEMNGNTVITRAETGHKWATGSPALYPRASIVDPRVQYGLPQHLTVYGGIDALSHILEYYFIHTDEETTTSMNEALMRTLFKVVDRLIEEPENYAARADMAWSSTLALNGLSGVGMEGGDWSSHIIEHGLSAVKPNVAHGAGLAVIMPAWIECVQDVRPQAFRRFAEQVWGLRDIGEAVAAMRETYSRWGAPTTLGELGFTREEMDKVREHAVEFAATVRHGEVGKLKPLTADLAEAVLVRAA